jgi:hypothetical protein
LHALSHLTRIATSTPAFVDTASVESESAHHLSLNAGEAACHVADMCRSEGAALDK